MDSTLENSIRSFLREHPVRGHAYVGFSGGIDSTALLLLLSKVCPDLEAIHFQHGIRGPEAEADAIWCENFCGRRGIDFRLIRLNVPQRRRPGESLEEAARRLRLEAWHALTLASDTPVFLAHHADDAMEELFLRLARGANASGLTSLRAEATVENIRLLRPLLTVRKDDLKRYLESQGITDWRTDSTNAENDYRRNAVRNKLLPLWREIFDNDASLLHAMQALQDDARLLEDEAAKLTPTTLSQWQDVPQALLPRVLRKWLCRETGRDLPPTRAVVLRVTEALAHAHGEQKFIPLDAASCIVVKQDGMHLVNCQAEPNEMQEITLAWNWKEQPSLHLPGTRMTLTAQITEGFAGIPSANEEYFDLEQMPQQLTVRSWKPGDAMIPFGRKTPKKLQDILTDAKIPAQEKQTIPVILANDTIIWLPGIKRAEYARATLGKNTLKLTLAK